MLDFNNATMADITDSDSNYMYSLLCDYEKFILEYGIVTLEDFIHSWTCIPQDAFQQLSIGDTVYDCVGNAYKIVDNPFESDDEKSYYVEVASPTGNSNFTDCYQTGDLYYEDVRTSMVKYKKKLRKESEKLCPILITKTSQHQS